MHHTFHLLLLLTLHVWRSVQVCAPDCADAAGSNNLVRDPTNCARYYPCRMINGEMHPSAVPLECPTGQYFDDVTNPANPTCADVPSTGSNVTYCENLCNPCEVWCDEPDDSGHLVPDPGNCLIFYVCLTSGPSQAYECESPESYYDYRAETCTLDDTVCYDYCDICEIHCTTSGERVPDPYNCHNFYECQPPHKALFECPDDYHFDATVATCLPGDTCTPICEV